VNNSLNYYVSNKDIIKYPIVTDKTTRLLENNQYTFIVDFYSDKISIKNAIEYLFSVKVTKVNTCHLPRKKKRSGASMAMGWKSQYKKAIVTLDKDDIINIFAED